MIDSKNKLNEYLKQDKMALGITRKHPKFMGDIIWKWQILYRKYEYYRNINKPYLLPYTLYLKIRFEKMSVKLGFSIPIHTFGPGLSIAHYGTIVVHGNARIGKNCRIQEGVTIGATNGSSVAPVIGDNVFIGSGAKIIGDINIADDVCIAAGGVVVHNIDECGITVGGVPAKKISDNNSHSNLNRALIRD